MAQTPKHREVRPADQPDEQTRRSSEKPDEEYRKEHRETTESPRWGEGGESREERGYPREGERNPEPPHRK